MKSRFTLLVALTFLFVACSPAVPVADEAPAGEEITITDALGREVVLDHPPERIVLTGKALFMIADAVYLFPDAMERVVGMGDRFQGEHNFMAMIDPAYDEKAILARDANAEQVAALQPDLVILKSYLADSVGAPIEALDIPVVYIDFETPEQYTRDLAILGDVFQNEARAEMLASYYQEQVADVEETVAGAEKPRVLILSYNQNDGNVAFSVPPETWIQTEMVKRAGGEPAWLDADLGNGWTQVSLEQIAAWDADQVFVISYFQPASDVVESLRTDPNWQALRATEEGELYPFPADVYNWGQPDTRWILGYRWLAAKMHPDLFPDFDIAQETQAFYEELYGLDESFYQENLLPLLRAE